MKYRVVIFDKRGSPKVYYFDEEYLATALYRAAILHEHDAVIFQISKGRRVKAM